MRIRAATTADSQAATAVVIAFDLGEYGVPDFELDDLLSEWESPSLDLGRDTWVVEDDEDGLTGYAILRADNEAGVFVRPEARGRGIGSRLLEAVEGRALERANGPVVVGQVLASVNEGGRALLERSGYAPVRTYWRMVRDLTEAPPQAEWPEGVSVRTFDPDRDARAVHGLIQSRTTSAIRRSPSRNGRSVPCAAAPSTRHSGSSMALLLSAFGEFHRRGRPYAGLGVDSWNRTGAKRLYEKVGMTVDREYARYEKKLQGRKTSILDRCPPVASPRWPE